MEDGIELSDLIWQLRAELTRAQLTGEGKGLRFIAESVDLELTLAVEKSSEKGLKARFWVLDGNAGNRKSAMSTQILRLRLKPVDGSDTGRSSLISGDTVHGER